MRIGDRFTTRYVEVVGRVESEPEVWGCRTDGGKHKLKLPIEEIERRSQVVNHERADYGDALIPGHTFTRFVRLFTTEGDDGELVFCDDTDSRLLDGEAKVIRDILEQEVLNDGA